MTTPLASSTFSPVLADHFGSTSLRRDALAVLAGAGLVGILAQVAIPMWPVPITGQTLGVLLVGAVLGARRGLECRGSRPQVAVLLHLQSRLLVSSLVLFRLHG